MSPGRGSGTPLAQGVAPPCSKTEEVDDVIIVTSEPAPKEATQDSRAKCHAATTRTGAGTRPPVRVRGARPHLGGTARPLNQGEVTRPSPAHLKSQVPAEDGLAWARHLPLSSDAIKAGISHGKSNALAARRRGQRAAWWPQGRPAGAVRSPPLSVLGPFGFCRAQAGRLKWAAVSFRTPNVPSLIATSNDREPPSGSPQITVNTHRRPKAKGRPAPPGSGF